MNARTEAEVDTEKLKRRIALRKLIIEEQRDVARLAQRCADMEYAKLKRMETELSGLTDKLVDLKKKEKERKND